MFWIGWNHELCRVPYGTLGNLGGGTDECHMVLLVGKGLMTSLDYKQVVQSPTFVSAGSLLDHVYVKGNFQTIQCSVLAVYYSDHDAVKISIF